MSVPGCGCQASEGEGYPPTINREPDQHADNSKSAGGQEKKTESQPQPGRVCLFDHCFSDLQLSR